jgi:hypothetical protein
VFSRQNSVDRVFSLLKREDASRGNLLANFARFRCLSFGGSLPESAGRSEA